MADVQKESSYRSPHSLGLKEAVRQIKESYEWAVGKQRPSPFFFVIGAGVSVPQVPLASEIIRYCKKKCEATEAYMSGTTVLEEYSRWLNQAFHAPELRQDYFRQLIEGKAIPTANFRLAHLLLGEGVKIPFTNLVVTTNFDNFLSRALSLFGKEYVLCDSPSTAPRLVLSNTDLLQIVHVHGSYQFYDIKNLSGKVERAAALSEETTATMASLLDVLLHDRSPVVVGYGGWDGDVFMKSLKRRLQGGTLAEPLYWCCYNRESRLSLPDWLQNNPNVRLVEPDPTTVGSITLRLEKTRLSSTVSPSIDAALLQDAGLASPATLQAQAVFDGLIQALQIPEPNLTRDPIAFFAEQLDRNLPKDEAASNGPDPYRIKSAIDEMRAAATWVQKYRLDRTAAQRELHRVREHLREATYSDAITAILKISLESLNQAERDDLLEMALEIVESSTFSAQLSEQTLKLLNRIQEIFAVSSQTNEATRRVGLARRFIPLNLVRVGRREESATELAIYLDYAKETRDPKIYTSAANLLYELAFEALGTESALAEKSFHHFIVVFGDSTDTELQSKLAGAFVGRGVALLTLNRSSEALEVYDELFSRFGNASDPIIRPLVSLALVNKGVALGQLNRSADAIAVCEEVVRRFGDASEPGIREQVANALNGIGYALVLRAKENWALEGQREFTASLKEAEKKIRAAIEYQPNNPITLGNMGYILFLQGQVDSASETLREAIRLGGEDLRQIELADAEINPVPMDNAFKELVRSIVSDTTAQGAEQGRF